MTATPRVRHLRTIMTGMAALALVSLLVVRTSQAAFTATTDNTGNSFSAGVVELESTAGVMFNVTAMAPGQAETRCIAVTYTGTVADPGEVRLYGGGFTQVPGAEPGSVGLGDYLDVQVEEVENGALGSCASLAALGAPIVSGTTLAGFNSTRTDHSTGAGSWQPSPGATRTYRFTVTLDASTPDSEQGAGVSDAAFVWEVRAAA